MKLWEKGTSTDQKIDQFTVGNDRELDLIIAKYDMLASMAHAKMLGEVSLLTTKEVSALEQTLLDLLGEVADGTFVIEDSFEDVHSKIESVLTERLGDVGKKIHTARSRNDQVLVALHLYLKDEIVAIREEVRSLFQILLDLAEKHKEVLLPGYTHLQIAMPSSFGLWFSAYAETLIDDLYVLQAAYKVCDQNPLGSAAGYGSSFPLDRTFTTQELGFHTMKYNVVAAQMSRGKVEKLSAFGLASIASTLAKLAMDVCLYMSQNFGFVSFPDAMTTGSSIMPHKKNPDVFELIRGKCNVLQGIPNQLALLTTNLPSGYHREMQLTKEILFPAIQQLKVCLELTSFTLKDIQVNTNILENSKYDHLFSVDSLNERVQQGMPFRDAYKALAEEIAQGTYQPNKEREHTHEGSRGNLCLESIREKMTSLTINWK